MASRLRVFIATSFDGFIAGPDGGSVVAPDPAGWIGEDYGYGAFIADVGCVLMGRATFDAVAAMDVPWPHPERDTVVATHRRLQNPPPRVNTASGSVAELVALAKEQAGSRDVWIDGGNLIRQALDARLVDEIVVTLCPTILGAGHSLFAGTEHRHDLRLKDHKSLPDSVVQLTYSQVR